MLPSRLLPSRLLPCLLLLALLAPPAAAQRAVPPLTGRVVDQAGVLSPDTEALLTALLAAHEDSTSNQVAVLTIPALDGEVLEDYGLRVARAWSLGQQGRDNGVLLLVAVADRKLRIEVGYGLEGALPDALAARIIRDEIVPAFRDGDYDAGVTAGVQAIVGALEGTYAPAEETGEEAVPWILGVFFLGMASLFAFFGVFSHGCGRWFLFAFLFPFVFVGGMALFQHVVGGLVVLLLYVALFVWATTRPGVREAVAKIKKAQKSGKHTKVRVGPFMMSTSSFSSSGGSGGSSFSGGGGSFGGGGASGSW